MSSLSLVSPRMPPKDVHELATNIFFRASTSNDSKFTYSTLNDFGKVVQTLLFCKPLHNFSEYLFKNIQEIGKVEGFEVKASESVYPVRDPKFINSSGDVLEPSCSLALPEAIGRCFKRAAHQGDHCAVVTKNPAFFCGMVGNVAKSKLHQRTSDGVDPSLIKGGRVYFEGGDTYFITNRLGTPKVMIGEDLITITHQVLRIDKWFAPYDQNVVNPSRFNEELLHKDELNQLYLNKKIPLLIENRAERIAQGLTLEGLKKVLNEMFFMGLLNKVSIATDQEIKEGKKIASNYLAQKEFVEKKVFPKELKVSEENLFVMPQIAYHLDCLLTSAPKGSVFMQSYEKSVQLLKHIQLHAKTLKLTDKDQDLLNNLIQETQKLEKEFCGIMHEAKEKLSENGYSIIPTPGAFYTNLQRKENNEIFLENVNFMNSLSGYSHETGHYYMIVPGTNIGDQLGKVLMDYYTEFLNCHCDNLAVYFVGHDPQNPSDFSESSYNVNCQTAQLGPHCLSFEVKIKPFTT